MPYLSGMICLIRLPGSHWRSLPSRSSNVIRCRLNTALPNEESYKLTVSSSSIHIDAKTPKGIFYAFQTLRQLLPSAIESDKQVAEKIKWNIPCVVIEDSPAFSYRGVMLDVSRHFIPKEDVKRHIDLLAFHKLNILHWHLTDDQGWRIEIKKYPKLTTVGGYRKKTIVGYMWDNPTEWNTKRYGGFYTREDIKEVVAYAKKRFVEIIPEIEMPGTQHGMTLLILNIPVAEDLLRWKAVGVFSMTFIVLRNLLLPLCRIFWMRWWNFSLLAISI